MPYETATLSLPAAVAIVLASGVVSILLAFAVPAIADAIRQWRFDRDLRDGSGDRE